MALMAGRGGHWALPEVKGYAARQQLANGYALAHRAHRDGRQLSTRREVITAGQATRHLGAIDGSLSPSGFSKELEDDYMDFGYLSNVPWVMSGGEPDDVELPLEDGYEDALAQLAARGMEGPSDFAPVRGKFGAVGALTPSFASLLQADQAPPGALAAAPAFLWNSSCMVLDYGDGGSGRCVPLHYSLAAGVDCESIVSLARTQAASILATPGSGLPWGMRDALRGLLRGGAVSPWAYGYLDPAQLGRLLLLTDSCDGPSTLVFPRGSSYVHGKVTRLSSSSGVLSMRSWWFALTPFALSLC